MKITGRIEVFKGRTGLLAKLSAFNKDGEFTGAVYMPVIVPEDVVIGDGETVTINVTDGYLNSVTSVNEEKEVFTHLSIRVVECEVLKVYKPESNEKPKKVAKKSSKEETEI